MRVADAVGRTVAALGADTAFGVIGSGNLHVSNALRDGGARFVHARHECGAVCMADAHARLTGSVGIATVHQGPGVTNAVTGLTEAAKARTPLLLLAGATSTGATRSNFLVDQDGLATSVGADAVTLGDPDTAVEEVVAAYVRARDERRAVLVSLPLDVQAGEVADDVVPAGPPPPPPPSEPDPVAVRALADLLAGADRPAVVAGRGAVLAGAGGDLVALAERTGAVLATSANANGLFADDPFALGIAGGFAPPVAAEVLRDADVLVAFGASLNMWTTRHGQLVGPATRVAQVDVDPHAPGTHRPVDLAVIGDAGATARAVIADLADRDHAAVGWRTPALAERLAAARWRQVPYQDATGGGRIDPRTLTIALDELLPGERTLVVDSGHFMGWGPMYLAVPDAAGFVFNQAFQSIGLGLASAIGAAVARPDRITVCTVGDGGLLMSLGELETAARLGLPLCVVVYDDAAYGAEVHHFGPEGAPVDLVRFDDVDFAGFGRAAGAEAAQVRTPDDLAVVEGWLQRRDRPLVLDAKVSRDVVAEWLEEAFRAH